MKNLKLSFADFESDLLDQESFIKLTPIDVVRFVAAFWMRHRNQLAKRKSYRYYWQEYKNFW